MSEMLAAIAKIVVIVFVSVFGLGEPDGAPEQAETAAPSALGWMR